MKRLMKTNFFKAAGILFVVILLKTHCLSFAAAALQNFTAAFFTPETPSSEENYITNEIILITADNDAYATVQSLKSDAPSDYIITDYYGDYCLVTPAASDSKGTSRSEALLEYFTASDKILVAEYNSELSLSYISDDEYSDAQWPLSNTGAYSQLGTDGNKYSFTSVYDVDMNIPEAWQLYTESVGLSHEVIIAIIDTGIDYMHPELTESMWVNYNEIPGDGVDNDGNGYVDDIYGWDFYNNDNTICHYSAIGDDGTVSSDPADPDDHGTHCAGIIAAAADNITGIAGVASNINVKIMSLKIHGGPKSKGTIANAVKAIKYASYMGADICNLSWGTTIYSEALENAIRESDMLFIAAAGNDASNIDITPLYPASFNLDNIISVTFTNADGLPTIDTNFGMSVDIAAPGASILSTVVGGYDTMSGSSMAAPHVAGVAAILYSTGYNYYPSEIKNLIINTLKPLPAFEDMIANAGMPDAYAALNRYTELVSDYTAPALTISQGFLKENFVIDFIADDFDGSGVRVIKYAPGKKDISAFRHGTSGTSVKNYTATITKSGDYTFYISDYAGNEAVYYYSVNEDETAPDISAYYSYSSENNIYVLQINASDSESGVKTLKYMQGEYELSDFRFSSSGTQIETDSYGNANIYVRSPGYYTFYAIDYRGNKSVKKLFVPDTLIDSISLESSGIMLSPGNEYAINVITAPAEATEKVSFHSSHPSVAKVNEHGIISALTPGFTVITVSTGQGLSKKCLVFVTYDSNIHKILQTN